MILTDANKIKPPVDIYVYAFWNNSQSAEVFKFSEEELKKPLTKTDYELKKLNSEHKVEVLEEEKEKRYLQYWSFIPLLPPDQVTKHLNYQTQAILDIYDQIKKIREELQSIPKIDSIMQMIHALQIQIGQVNPDPYHAFTLEKLKKGLSVANVPLGSGPTPPPAQNY